MPATDLYGYRGKLLRVDLGRSRVSADAIREEMLRDYIGGTILGARLIYDEVPPQHEWSSPQNILFLGSGPLGGTAVPGSGSISVVTRGALTGGATATQANGFLGAYLRFCGFDGIIIQGAAADWKYLYIHDGTAELRSAAHLLGRDTFETEDSIKQELGYTERGMSVACIGVAGENMVRFAGISVDKGHTAAHNGVGAVMGSKKLKAIAIARGKGAVPLKDRERLSEIAKEIYGEAMATKHNQGISRWGTLESWQAQLATGRLPIRNYTTSLLDISDEEKQKFSGPYIRGRYEPRPTPCWACRFNHSNKMKEVAGAQAGRLIDEPEYECLAAWSGLVGVTDIDTTVYLASEVDRLGMDTNEAGWLLAWLIECQEKGVISPKEADGIQLRWGDAGAIAAMLGRIARRQGFGNVLAEGVMRAAGHIGGRAAEMAVHTRKGNTPRGHDHRSNWFEMFDTCVSNTGTLESNQAIALKPLGLPPAFDLFNPDEVSAMVAKTKGAMIFDDSMVTCRFNTRADVDMLSRAVNAATGWELTVDDAMAAGMRAVNLMRLFNLRCGIAAELDAPSPRYGSTPADGPTAGRGVMPHWQQMLRNYYKLMGWDEAGKPLPQTLNGLGLDFAVPHLARL